MKKTRHYKGYYYNEKEYNTSVITSKDINKYFLDLSYLEKHSLFDTTKLVFEKMEKSILVLNSSHKSVLNFYGSLSGTDMNVLELNSDKFTGCIVHEAENCRYLEKLFLAKKSLSSVTVKGEAQQELRLRYTYRLKGLVTLTFTEDISRDYLCKKNIFVSLKYLYCLRSYTKRGSLNKKSKYFLFRAKFREDSNRTDFENYRALYCYPWTQDVHVIEQMALGSKAEGMYMLNELKKLKAIKLHTVLIGSVNQSLLEDYWNK